MTQGIEFYHLAPSNNFSNCIRWCSSGDFRSGGPNQDISGGGGNLWFQITILELDSIMKK